jgi:hypothetical protein
MQREGQFSLRQLLTATTVCCCILAGCAGFCRFVNYLREDDPGKVVTSRDDWPRELEELIASSELAPDEVESIEVVEVGWAEGWVCRMACTPATVALVTNQWIPVSKTPAQGREEVFLRTIPTYWKPRTKLATGSFYAHPNYSTSRDSNGTAYMALIDDEHDKVVIWFYFNF